MFLARLAGRFRAEDSSVAEEYSACRFNVKEVADFSEELEVGLFESRVRELLLGEGEFVFESRSFSAYVSVIVESLGVPLSSTKFEVELSGFDLFAIFKSKQQLKTRHQL